MSAENTTDLERMLEVAEGKITETEHPAGIEMNEWVFTNDKTNPFVRQQFHMLMNAAFSNQLGVMHAKVRDTDEIKTILVWVTTREEGGVVTYPIATFINPDDAPQFLAPDGSGGYIDGTV